mmetsp:Transcript_6561/g.18356  ORF Transcript_6561/g.18356 Transcript_6561/m.18356 type:complete len:297 (-) Transcript_6561:1140-2030(-)
MRLAQILLSLLLLDLVRHVLVLALEVENLLLPVGELDRSLVPLVLDTAQLRLQDLRVHLDFLLALLHADLELLLPVLKPVEGLVLRIQLLLQPLHLEPEDVVLHEGLLLLLHGLCDCAIDDRVLQLELLHHPLHALVVLLDAGHHAVHGFQVRVLALYLGGEDRVEALLFTQLLVEFLDLPVEVLLLLDGPLARDTRNLALHQLGLVVHRVEELLLPLPLLVEPADLELEVLDGGLRPADLAEGRGLLSPKPVELLAFFVEAVLRGLHLLLNSLEIVEHVGSCLLRVPAFLVLLLG